MQLQILEPQKIERIFKSIIDDNYEVSALTQDTHKTKMTSIETQIDDMKTFITRQINGTAKKYKYNQTKAWK